MAYVVGGALLGDSERDRQHRLRAVQRLDLRFLIDRQHHSTARRVEVEPDNIGNLLGERRVAADFEGAVAVRLQPAFPPELRHVVVRHVRALGPQNVVGHLPARPVRQPCLGWRTRPGQRQNPSADPRTHLLSRRTTLSTRKTGGTFLSEPTDPEIHGRQRHTRKFCNLLPRSSLRTPQHDPRPRRDYGRNIRATNHRPQLSSLSITQVHPEIVCPVPFTIK